MLLVNVSEGLRASAVADINAVPMAEILLYGTLPAMVAAFCYPISNQLVWQVSYNSKKINAEKRYATEHKTRENNAVQQSSSPKSNAPQLITEAALLNAINAADATTTTVNTVKSPTATPKSTLQNLIARIPAIETPLLQDAFNKVWLMTLGSLPF